MSSISEVRKDVRVCLKWIPKYHKSISAKQRDPSDYQKYNENLHFLGNFFSILFIIKYDLYFFNGYLEV